MFFEKTVARTQEFDTLSSVGISGKDEMKPVYVFAPKCRAFYRLCSTVKIVSKSKCASLSLQVFFYVFFDAGKVCVADVYFPKKIYPPRST